MLDQIKLFFEQHILLANDQQPSEPKIQIACAALLIEMMLIDNVTRDQEQKSIFQRLEALFQLTAEQTGKLFELATQQREQSTDYFQFTHLINQEFTAEQKIQLIESLWRIALADGHLDDYEEHMVRKIAELLYVPHKDFILSKNRVLDDNLNHS